MKQRVTVTVNARVRELLVDTRMVLADMLREELRLTGTHIGCGTGSCGACTVVLNGVTAKSCCVLAVDTDGDAVETIESLSTGPDDIHLVQEAFIEKHGLQCGFCTPGMILSARQLLADNPDPSDAEIRHAIVGNLCRCTGYVNVVTAVRAAAEAMSETPLDAVG